MEVVLRSWREYQLGVCSSSTRMWHGIQVHYLSTLRTNCPRSDKKPNENKRKNSIRKASEKNSSVVGIRKINYSSRAKIRFIGAFLFFQIENIPLYVLIYRRTRHFHHNVTISQPNAGYFPPSFEQVPTTQPPSYVCDQKNTYFWSFICVSNPIYEHPIFQKNTQQLFANTPFGFLSSFTSFFSRSPFALFYYN